MPPAEQILSLYCQTLAKVSRLSATEEICGRKPEQPAAAKGSAPGSGDAPCPRPATAQVFLRFPGDYREQAGRSYTVVSTPLATVKAGGGVVLAAKPDVTDRYRSLLTYRDPVGLAQALSSDGVDLSVCTLGRFRKRICYVIGAAYPDLSRPQVWLDKETLQPARYVIAPAASTDGPPRLECLYDSWKTLASAKGAQTLFPGKMTLVREGETVWVRTVKAVKADPELAPRLFDVDAVAEETRKDAGTLGADETELKEVRDLVEGFDQMFR
ncbi:MAG: hypothetical protein AB1921_07980 [Thermodesulfobacteriota bacterium]